MIYCVRTDFCCSPASFLTTLLLERLSDLRSIRAAVHENRTLDRRARQHGGRDRGDGNLGPLTLAIRLANQLRIAAGGEGFKGMGVGGARAKASFRA